MTSSSRRGLALPAAVFTIAVITLFIAGSAFAAAQEARAALGTLAERVALETAEYGAVTVLRDWDPSWNIGVGVGATIGPRRYVLPGGPSASVRLTRTTLTTWWVISDGLTGSSARREGRRTVNALVRLDPPPDVDAALGVADSASVTGTGAVIGDDSVEVSGLCATASSTAGVAAPDTTRITGRTGISGTPPLRADSATARVSAQLDSLLTPDIVLPDGAIVTPAPVVVAGSCDTSVVTNWGDPDGGVCRGHFPVIKAMGDVVVRGGRGQGILIAAGDVRFENGALFAGIVTARDDFVTGSGGGVVLGAVVAGDARRGTGDHSVVGTGGLIRRSSCRVRLERLAAAQPTRITQRWWAEFD